MINPRINQSPNFRLNSKACATRYNGQALLSYPSGASAGRARENTLTIFTKSGIVRKTISMAYPSWCVTTRNRTSAYCINHNESVRYRVGFSPECVYHAHKGNPVVPVAAGYHEIGTADHKRPPYDNY
jgi:hypothetical protein